MNSTALKTFYLHSNCTYNIVRQGGIMVPPNRELGAELLTIDEQKCR